MVSGEAAMVESWCSVRQMISFIREFSSSRLMVLCVMTSLRCWKNNFWYSASNFWLRLELGIMRARVAEGR